MIIFNTITFLELGAGVFLGFPLTCLLWWLAVPWAGDAGWAVGVIGAILIDLGVRIMHGRASENTLGWIFAMLWPATGGHVFFIPVWVLLPVLFFIGQ